MGPTGRRVQGLMAPKRVPWHPHGTLEFSDTHTLPDLDGEEDGRGRGGHRISSKAVLGPAGDRTGVSGAADVGGWGLAPGDPRGSMVMTARAERDTSRSGNPWRATAVVSVFQAHGCSLSELTWVRSALVPFLSFPSPTQ